MNDKHESGSGKKSNGGKKVTDIRNLTPHDVHVLVCGGAFDNLDDKVTFKAQDVCVRVKTKQQKLLYTLPNGAQVWTPASFEDGELQGFPYLPDADQDHPDLIVSMVVGNAIPSWYRGCVYTPDTGPASAVRDDSGKIVAVKRLCLVHAGDSSTLPSL